MNYLHISGGSSSLRQQCGLCTVAAVKHMDQLYGRGNMYWDKPTVKSGGYASNIPYRTSTIERVTL